ncbi:MAG TPA: ribonuclease P protein component [Acidimicrobiia bacterium]|nr:ribonuclease P protein component [Acidimicrobiia bacterium]
MIWRVRDRATFEALTRAPRHRVGPVALRSCRDGSDTPARVAYAVGRRTGTAVDRNRIRRRLRAAVAANAVHLHRGAAYLFEADRAVLSLAFADLQGVVGRLVRRAGEDRS